MNLKEFINPPKQFRPSPFWSWNSEIESAEVETQIRDMKKKGFGGFFMHSAFGLKTTYMSDDWMKAVRRATEVANELKIEAWLHDEDRYPSGFSGGTIPKSKVEHLPMSLTWAEDASSLDSDILDNALAFTERNAEGIIKLLQEKPDDLSGIGVFYERRFTRGHSRYNGQNYTDLLNPDTVKTFLDTTHEKYIKLFKYDFGEYMPGIFTDGPHVNRSTTLFNGDGDTRFSFPWTTGFAEYFEKIHGYSPLEHLHHLLSCSDEGFKFRHDFWLAVHERFIESFTIPISSWCRENNVLFAGHYPLGNEFYGMISSGGSVMSHYEYLDIPGSDNPGQNPEHILSIKQASSVANQLGKKRVIGKIFGSSGYSLSFEDMKQTATVQCALGATFLSPQHVQYSMTGPCKKSDPTTFSYHQPYWESFRVMNDYLARCSWAVSQGRTTLSVLILSPLSSAYGALDPDSEDGGTLLKSIEESYHNVIEELLAEHIAFDIGDERIIARHGSVSGDTLTVGNTEYNCIIVPYSLSWRSATLDLIESFTGQVVIMGEVPSRVDGALSDRASRLLDKKNITSISDIPSKVANIVVKKFGRDVSIKSVEGSEARSVLVNHRMEAAAHILFLANTDRENNADIIVTVNALGGVVELDPVTGRAYRYDSEIAKNSTVIKTSIPTAGVKIFLLDQTQTSVMGEEKPFTEKTLTIEGPYSFKTLQENSLTIERCTFQIDGRTIMENAPVWKVKKAAWHETGISEYWGYQPWTLKEKNVRSKTNETVLTFNFTVKDIPETIALAMETSDRYKIEINGTELDFTPGKWHIDRRIRVFNLKDNVVEGTNTVKATTDLLWDTEIENIYILGDFAVGPEQDGFPIIKEPETLNIGDWCTQGYPFYSGSIVYKMEFSLEKDEAARYEIDLSGAAGSTFHVTVNETDVGSIPFSPYRGDITGALKNGDNTLEVEITGTLRNILGPHHHKGKHIHELIKPENFCEEADGTESYHFVPYGLIKPPKIVKIL